MGTAHLLRGTFTLVTFPALDVIAVCAMNSVQTEHNDKFVQRDGTRVTLGDDTFRYCGSSIKWLGLEACDAVDPMGLLHNRICGNESLEQGRPE